MHKKRKPTAKKVGKKAAAALPRRHQSVRTRQVATGEGRREEARLRSDSGSPPSGRRGDPREGRCFGTTRQEAGRA